MILSHTKLYTFSTSDSILTEKNKGKLIYTKIKLTTFNYNQLDMRGVPIIPGKKGQKDKGSRSEMWTESYHGSSKLLILHKPTPAGTYGGHFPVRKFRPQEEVKTEPWDRMR